MIEVLSDKNTIRITVIWIKIFSDKCASIKINSRSDVFLIIILSNKIKSKRK
jgi:hypothetical protein